MADDPPGALASVRSRSNVSASEAPEDEDAPEAGQQPEAGTESSDAPPPVPPAASEAAAVPNDTTTNANATTAAEDTRSYLTKLSDMQKEAIDSIYATTIDAPCQHVRELEHTIQESFLNCQQFDFLHFLKTEEGQVDESVYARNAPISPAHCEYCGATSTDDCGPSCGRPKLFFRNKRPPFANNDDEWDPDTEYRVVKTEAKEEQNGSSYGNGVMESEQSQLQQQTTSPIPSVAANGDAVIQGGGAADNAIKAAGDEIDVEAEEDEAAWALLQQPFGKMVFEC
eukprot:CAMPEP_0178532330 /NCGR_PEP_ID=MMETSP0696-20121128/33912_1 /TAXON_ID=265572 /ORGANISM="Extubocellulus spinifer, Strain CCMP396" /LENGTH=283 /DNA_ID=CAMNT_0020164311 /DNA_START=346 /DNA_END=1200 /DNA_ORIENTATION=-